MPTDQDKQDRLTAHMRGFLAQLERRVDAGEVNALDYAREADNELARARRAIMGQPEREKAPQPKLRGLGDWPGALSRLWRSRR